MPDLPVSFDVPALDPAEYIEGVEDLCAYLRALESGELGKTDLDRGLVRLLEHRAAFLKRRTELFAREFEGRSGKFVALAGMAVIATNLLKKVNRGDANSDHVLGTLGRMMQGLGFPVPSHFPERLSAKADPSGQSWISAHGGPAKAARAAVALASGGFASPKTIERVQKEVPEELQLRLVDLTLDLQGVHEDLRRMETEGLVVWGAKDPSGAIDIIPPEQFERLAASGRPTRSYKKPRRADR